VHKNIKPIAWIHEGILADNDPVPILDSAVSERIKKGQSGIISASREGAPMTLVAALRVGERVLGSIVLHNNSFTAADLKLLTTLADALHLSTSQLQRKISTMTDLSPLQIIRDLRLRKAKELLRNTDKNITEIAYEAGFNDPSYFTRIFSKAEGVTPSEWKEAHL
jgi:AraC-like DNA-binding protein